MNCEKLVYKLYQYFNGRISTELEEDIFRKDFRAEEPERRQSESVWER
jgi:hypothetical protein